jgi:hypothetical protein
VNPHRAVGGLDRSELKCVVSAKKQEPIVVATKGSASDVWLEPKFVSSFRWRLESRGIEEGDTFSTRRSIDGNKRWGRALLKDLLEPLFNLRGDGEPSIKRDGRKPQFARRGPDEEDAAIAVAHYQNSIGEGGPLHAQ